MITKNQIQLIQSLQTTKGRKINQLFVAEGKKCIEDLLRSDLELIYLLETESIFESTEFSKIIGKTIRISASDLKKISSLAVPNNCLGVFAIPKAKQMLEAGLILALDNIQDPGNLGTIIRLCDWFGVQQIICSKNTVDVYNPKVIQATMGAIVGVSVVYTDLEKYLLETKLPIFGTLMNGENIYNSKLPTSAIVVMGNEGKGISENIENRIKNRISIPSFNTNLYAESLNVATATAVVLSEFRRRLDF